MKPTKITYYTGKKLDFTYEYRGFKYSREVKKFFKDYGLKISKIIDNCLDKDISKILFEDNHYTIEILVKNNQIYVGKIKKETFKYKN